MSMSQSSKERLKRLCELEEKSRSLPLSDSLGGTWTAGIRLLIQLSMNGPEHSFGGAPSALDKLCVSESEICEWVQEALSICRETRENAKKNDTYLSNVLRQAGFDFCEAVELAVAATAEWTTTRNQSGLADNGKGAEEQDEIATINVKLEPLTQRSNITTSDFCVDVSRNDADISLKQEYGAVEGREGAIDVKMEMIDEIPQILYDLPDDAIIKEEENGGVNITMEMDELNQSSSYAIVLGDEATTDALSSDQIDATLTNFPNEGGKFDNKKGVYDIATTSGSNNSTVCNSPTVRRLRHNYKPVAEICNYQRRRQESIWQKQPLQQAGAAATRSSKCTHCGLLCTTKRSLKMHVTQCFVNAAAKLPKIICPTCSQPFFSTSGIMTHMRTCSGTLMATKNLAAATVSLKCPGCRQAGFLPQGLKAHMSRCISIACTGKKSSSRKAVAATVAAVACADVVAATAGAAGEQRERQPVVKCPRCGAPYYSHSWAEAHIASCKHTGPILRKELHEGMKAMPSSSSTSPTI